MSGRTVYVALLRGINVGGRATVAMAQLRRLAEECGFADVATYIQSGNLLFSTAEPARAATERLEREIAAAGGPAPRVALRSRAELAAVVAGNPYLDRATDPKQLHVAFAVHDDEPPAPLEDLSRFAPDELTVSGREFYLYLPNGLGRSKLAAALTGRKSTDTTVRNWRTVTTLLRMAEEIDAG